MTDIYRDIERVCSSVKWDPVDGGDLFDAATRVIGWVKDQQRDEYTERVRRAGYEHGKAKGSWVVDGNTPVSVCVGLLKGIEEGDPEVMDLCPVPLSGEWDGESINELVGPDHDDDDLDNFERAFQGGFWDEVERSCRYQLGQEDGDA